MSAAVAEVELISIHDAAARGIDRVRMPRWANELDHIKIDIIDGKPGPWTHLFTPFNKVCNGRDPQDLLFTMMDYGERAYLPYHGALPDSDEYKAAQAVFEGSMS